MLVYHGSAIKIEKPDLTLGRYNLDFGKGFYTTTLKEQSEKWAKRKVTAERLIDSNSQAKPIVNVYEFNKSEDLKILSFDGYTEKWLDFIVENRSKEADIQDTEYDVVYGNVADDDVAREVNNYLELLNKNRVNEDVKKALLYQLQFQKVNNQYCFITEKAIRYLKYIESYTVEE